MPAAAFAAAGKDYYEESISEGALESPEQGRNIGKGGDLIKSWGGG